MRICNAHLQCTRVNSLTGFQSLDGINLWSVILNGGGSCRLRASVRHNCIEIWHRERQQQNRTCAGVRHFRHWGFAAWLRGSAGQNLLKLVVEAMSTTSRRWLVNGAIGCFRIFYSFWQFLFIWVWDCLSAEF